jgi:thiol:disulfide interchange protein DsbD
VRSEPSSEPASATVALSLVADVPLLVDEPFWLGARLVPPSGAHLYWKNPGETGLATTAEFASPDGYELSVTQYPGPVSFVSERSLVGYGYLGETVLLARVTPTQGEHRATFLVRASWLSCDHVCVQESGQAELLLRRDAVGAATPLEPFVERVPISGGPFAVEWLRDLEFTLAGPKGVTLVEWFDVPPIAVDDRAPTSTPLDDGRLHVALGTPTRPARLEAVVRAETADGIRYFDVDLDVSNHPDVNATTSNPDVPAQR